MPISDFIRMHGIEFTIVRNGVKVEVTHGLKDTDAIKRVDCVRFFLGTDVQENDTLIFPDGKEVVVSSVETFYAFQKPDTLIVYYQSKSEAAASKSANTVFNIGTVTNSVVGSNNIISVTIQEMRIAADQRGGADKDELNEIISLLERITGGKEQPREGMFSKFSACMERHSWLSGSIAAALLGWLFH